MSNEAVRTNGVFTMNNPTVQLDDSTVDALRNYRSALRELCKLEGSDDDAAYENAANQVAHWEQCVTESLDTVLVAQGIEL